jgi:hypothetical protein
MLGQFLAQSHLLDADLGRFARLEGGLFEDFLHFNLLFCLLAQQVALRVGLAVAERRLVLFLLFLWLLIFFDKTDDFEKALLLLDWISSPSERRILLKNSLDRDCGLNRFRFFRLDAIGALRSLCNWLS